VNQPVDFTRAELMRFPEAGGMFEEIRDIKWVNPREFHRKTMALIEDLGYHVVDGADERIDIRPESIGSRSGTVESRIVGRKRIDGSLKFPVRPLRQMAFVLMGLGLVIALVAFSMFFASIVAALVTSAVALVVMGGASLAYQYQRDYEVGVSAYIHLYLLGRGEATERTIQRQGADVSDLFAQLSLSVAAGRFHQIHHSSFPDAATQEAFIVAFKELAPAGTFLMGLVPVGQSPYGSSLVPATAAAFRNLFAGAERDYQQVLQQVRRLTGGISDASAPVVEMLERKKPERTNSP
jgi:hypothetical protein